MRLDTRAVADGIRFKTTQTQFGVALGDTSLSEIAADYWAAIGVDVEVNVPVDTSGHWQAISRDHSYEGMTSAMLGFDHGDPMWMMRAFGHSEGTVNIPGVQDEHLDSLIEAAEAATTLEDQQRRLKEADAYMIKNHYYVWYFKVPMFNVNQPWLVGYNGEFQLGWGQRYGQLWARLWIDSEMKEAMGY